MTSEIERLRAVRTPNAYFSDDDPEVVVVGYVNEICNGPMGRFDIITVELVNGRIFSFPAHMCEYWEMDVEDHEQ